MRIAEVARRSGFPAATLRYYEQIDLLPAPQRTAAGYRAYDESVLARLEFIARAKAIGCTLDEIADLMPRWDGGRCAPVQERLREVAAAKVEEAEARAADLAAFTADLRRILATLGSHTPDGPCDARCGCVGDTPEIPDPPVACTLEAAEVPGRVEDWNAVLAHVTGREAVDGGVRLRLGATAPIERLVSLCQAEQACCRFFAFALTFDSRGAALEVRAPADAQHVVASLFGAAPPPEPTRRGSPQVAARCSTAS